MACCQRQTPTQDDRELPKRGDRDQSQVVLALVLPAGLPGDNAGHGAAIAAILSGLQSRLAPPTLRSEHVCMEV